MAECNGDPLLRDYLVIILRQQGRRSGHLSRFEIAVRRRVRNVRVPHEGHCYHVRSADGFNEGIIAFASQGP
jgi:hypothetical protein